MKNAKDAFLNLHREWEGLIVTVESSRTTENTIEPYGFGNKVLRELDLPWHVVEEVVNQDSHPLDSMYEQKLVIKLAEIKNKFISARDQGVPWLFGTNFLEEFGDVMQLCCILIPLVRDYQSKTEDLDISSTKAALKNANSIASKLNEASTEAGRNVSKIFAYAVIADGVKTTLDAAQENLKESSEKLKKSIEDLNKQGLSGAYADAANKFGLQRFIFGLLFAVAMIGIYCIGSTTGTSVGEFEKFTFIRTIALTAPCIWFGWVCVKNLGQLAKVQQDYEYKKVIALAFEAHKRETVEIDANDKELSKQLLHTVLKNFGENPVRLMDGKKREESAHPLEEAIRQIEESKVLGLLERTKNIIK